MAIKISGTTIVNDSRVVENADKIGIGRTTPRYDLEILSDAVPTGIAVSVTSTQATETNKGLTIFNNGQSPTFTVSYKGRVDAEEYYGTFKGTIDTGVSIENANNVQITDDTTGSGTHYIHFGSATSGYDGVEVDSTDLVYKDRKVGIGTDNPTTGKLEIADSAQTNLLTLKRTSGNSGELSVQLGGSDPGVMFTTSGLSDDFVFKPGGTERLRIDSNGRLLKSGQAALTSTSLSHPMQVAADSSAQNIVLFGRASDDISAIDFYEADKSTRLGEIQYRTNELNIRHRSAGADIIFATTPSGGSLGEKVRIDSNGKLGIGMNSDQQTALKGKLDIDASGIDAAGDTDDPNDYAIVIRNPSTTNQGNGIAFTNDSGANVGGAIIHIDKGSNNIGDLAFYTSATSNTPVERLRITADGHLKPGATDTYDIGIDASNRFRTVYAQTFNGAFQGTADVAAKVAVADESTDTSCFPLFATAATGDLAAKSGSNLTFNSNTGALGATSFVGGLPITDGANNRIITATSASAIKGEANLTFDGSLLSLSGDMQFTNTNPELEFNNGGPRFRVPAANTLVIHNGGGLGTTDNEVLRIDENGNIGVNATPSTSTTAGSLYSTVDHFLVIGDSDTGIAQDGDGEFEIWANNQEIVNFSTVGVDPKKSILPSGSINIGSNTTKISHGYFTNITADNITAELTGSASLLDLADDTTETDGFILFSNASGADQSIKTNDFIRYNASIGSLNLSKTNGGIKFGPGTATTDDAYIEWLGANNAGYLRIAVSDDQDAVATAEYIEFGDYNLTGGFNAANQGFTQHVKIQRSEFLVRTGSNTISQADRLKIDKNGNIGFNCDAATTGTIFTEVDHFIAIGDSDTGIAQDGDGQLEIWANNQEIVNFSATQITPTKSIVPSVTDSSLNLGSSSNRWGTIYADTLDGTISGTISNATNAANILVTQRDTNATHYLTFVASDPSGTNLALYGDDDLQFNPESNRLSAAQMKPGGIVDSSDGTGTANYYIKANGSGGWSWSQVSGNTGLDVSFLDLTDTPGGFSGQANKVVKVNSSSNALIFADDTNTNTTYQLKCTKDSDGGSTGNDTDPYLFLDASTGTDDSIQIAGSSGVSVTRDNDGKLTIGGSGSSYNTIYALSVPSSTTKIRLSGSDASEDDVEIVGSGSVTVTRNNATKLTINGAPSGVTDVAVSYTGRTSPCTLPITISGSATKTINIPDNSNAFGAKYVQNTEPTGTSVCDGDVWYDTTTSGSGGGGTIPIGGIIMWSGADNAVPSNWALCNGSNGTPNLVDRFIVGRGSAYAQGATGGSANATLVEHSHTINNHTHTIGGNTGNRDLSHTHSYSSANHPTSSGPEQNQSGSPEDRVTFNVGKTTGGASIGSSMDHNHSLPANTGNPNDRGTNSQGSSATNANLPPYYAIAYIMRVS
tara:strand:- start:900 stop:5174 length:4275 start_codon:yes stop_codon:yes gene_type:complete